MARRWSCSTAASTTCSDPPSSASRTGWSAVGRADGPVEPVTVVGPLCTGLDVLARRTQMSRPEVGDLLAVLDVGAYGFTESMPFFLSHPIPAEVVVQAGRVALVRPRQDPGEWLARQTLPAW